MQIRNNYSKMVFNGDIGRISAIDAEDGVVRVLYADLQGSRQVDYELTELDDLSLAYAVSVHKSQGSEYRAVVLPFSTQHYMMLQRNLLYTAITRARELVVLVGSKKAVAIAVGNNRTEERFTGLTHVMQQGWLQ
jgi:exodeoxyribonuclease V alpha subunit